MACLSAKSVFITGASRGIGLELVKELVGSSDPPKNIFATCRNPESAKELQDVASKFSNVHIKKFDVMDYGSYSEMVKWVETALDGDGLNLLINNAAQYHPLSLSEVTWDSMVNELKSNAVAPLIITQAFLPLLKKAAALSNISGMSCSKAAVVNMSSDSGSIAENVEGGFYPYGASKAALNMITKSLSVDLKSMDILAVVLHPGWVLTDMGGPNALINVETSVKGLLVVMESLKADDTGTFREYTGNVVPW